MKPCDCNDMRDVGCLNEQGIRINDASLTVLPLSVVIECGPCTLKISQRRFRAMAEWYLEDQKPGPKKTITKLVDGGELVHTQGGGSEPEKSPFPNPNDAKDLMGEVESEQRLAIAKLVRDYQKEKRRLPAVSPVTQGPTKSALPPPGYAELYGKFAKSDPYGPGGIYGKTVFDMRDKKLR